MRWAPALAACLLVAACAQGPRASDRQATQRETLQRAQIHTELAAAYYQTGQYAVSLEEIEKALSADPEFVPALNQLGLVYLALGKEREAQAQFQKALRLDPNDSALNNNYGMLLCRRGRDREAMRYFEKALSNPLYQTPEVAYVNAGLCARSQGDLARAEEFMRKARALAPDQPQALFVLADINLGRGNAREARELIMRHLRVVNPGPDSLWLAARIEHRLGDQNALAAYGAQLNRRFPDALQTRLFNEGKFE
ncbi:MAG TPA: type IV pilus biogenesis/stability protein PilW [Burkholderiales bacterium]|jgi:type IV pilus assembly protein PilF|nr:type IV pilus biogenesis/stability protein PilW [Burkholderiales bacterium]